MTRDRPRAEALRVELLTPARWPDLEALFGEKGACAGCWCMCWRLEKGERFDDVKGPRAKARFKALVLEGKAHGHLAYRGDEPVFEESMSLCRLSIFAALAFALAACPTPNPTPDANDVPFVPENPTARDACSGGCAGNQLCDTATRTCRDACGGCDAGICVKVSEGVFQCREKAVTCGSNLCDPGQIACLGGACSCLSSLSGALDTCQVASKWCNGKVCSNPKTLEQCTPGCTTAMCPTGYACQRVFGEDKDICTKICSDVTPPPLCGKTLDGCGLRAVDV